MRLKKLGNACVRIEHGGRTLVIDPGVFTDPGAVVGADGALESRPLRLCTVTDTVA